MFVVAGVSGNTGSVVAETLLAAGSPVRVIVRDAAKGAPWVAKGAEVRIADLADAAALGAALEGADGAYLLVPPNPVATDPLAYMAGVVDAIVAAVALVPHVVFLSSIGAEQVDGTGPIRGLHAAEPRLVAAAAATTFVRAAYFMENWGGSLGALDQGILPVFSAGNVPFEQVATRDIGRVAAAALLAGPKGHQVIELAGPAPLSAADVAEVVSTIVGKPIVVHEATIEGLIPLYVSFGMSAGMAGLYDEMTRGMGQGKLRFLGTPTRGTVPVDVVLRRLLGR